jgi:hypothetical protein
MSVENVDRKSITNKFDDARLVCIKVATEQEFDVEGDPQTAPWLKRGVRKAKSGERVTAADLREFDKSSGII